MRARWPRQYAMFDRVISEWVEPRIESGEERTYRSAQEYLDAYYRGFEQMTNGPFYTAREAAQYCGYALETFRRKLREYDVPRHGPEKNRFAQSVLDAFMVSPETFRPDPAPRRRRRKPLSLRVK